jgi:hypothetical protein
MDKWNDTVVVTDGTILNTINEEKYKMSDIVGMQLTSSKLVFPDQKNKEVEYKMNLYFE